MKYFTYVCKRKWLNPAISSDSGAISYIVEDDYNAEVYASLSLWDCGRKVTLDFSFNATDPKQSQERAKKINLLIESLIEMRDAMGEAFNDKANNTTDIHDDL
jgi:hypothetical protein